VAQITAEFQKNYGRVPRWIAAAPGRVNVIARPICQDCFDRIALGVITSSFVMRNNGLLLKPRSNGWTAQRDSRLLSREKSLITSGGWNYLPSANQKRF
jgi:hypothetical protein